MKREASLRFVFRLFLLLVIAVLSYILFVSPDTVQEAVKPPTVGIALKRSHASLGQPNHAGQPIAPEVISSQSSGSNEEDSSQTDSVDLYGVVLKVVPLEQTPESSRLRMVGESARLQRVTVRLDTAGIPDSYAKQHKKKPLPDVIAVYNTVEANPAYNIPLQTGARVLLSLNTNSVTGKQVFSIANRDRTPALMILATLTLLAWLLIGGSQVARHVLLVAMMLLGVYKLLFPLILSGRGGAVPLTVLCVAFPLLAGLIHSSGSNINLRALSREQAVIAGGVLGGTAILSVILLIMGLITPLSGFSNEGLAGLWYRSHGMDYWLLYRASVLIGFQGFLFYLCRTLARQRESDAQAPFRERFHIIMQRGRGLLGPLVSSLGLLCLGLFLPLLLQMEGTPTAQFINLESTASLFVFAFSGGLTLILTMPLMALLVAWPPPFLAFHPKE
jgi:uncharacterized membrane protein